MSALNAARGRRISVVLCAIGLALGLAACGKSGHPPSTENDGVYEQAGPITYQLQISRELNQYSTEDRQYVDGLPSGMSTSLGPDELWYGVFLWAKNQTKDTHTTSGNFRIVDTQNNHYYPVPVDPKVNQYAWTPQPLGAGAIEPAPNTAASFGPTQGGLLLFRLPIAVYDNRPLTLQILGPGGTVWGSVSLDL